MKDLDNTAERKEWMSVLAKAPAKELEKTWSSLGQKPEFEWLRAPEIGAIMVRGALGGTGAPFNLGEMTVTRCSLKLSCGTVGHAYVAGRDRQKAEVAALCDAMMQTQLAADVSEKVLKPLRQSYGQLRKTTASKAAATKVDFFTMVRGED